jgi:hypothetical protein
VNSLKASLPWRLVPKQDWPYLLAALGVFLVTAIRAGTTGLSTDEAATYLRYCLRDNPWGFLATDRANNHPLNSLLVYCSAYLLPFNEAAIRLPNLLSFVVYLWLAVGISRRFTPRAFPFGLLVLNYSLAEYFGLARGYAMAAALVLAACAVFPERLNDERGFVLSACLVLLACFANPMTLAVVPAFFLEALIAKGRRFLGRTLRAYPFHSLALLIGLSIASYDLLAVSAAGKPLLGDPQKRFWHPIVMSQIKMFLPELGQHDGLMLGLVVPLAALAAAAVIAAWRRFRYGRCATLVFVTIVASSQLLDKPMPMKRLLLPFWPLVALAIAEALDFHINWTQKRRPRMARLLRIAGWALLVILAVNFARRINMDSTTDWRSSYPLARAVSTPLSRGECVPREILARHPVVSFYLRKYGKREGDPGVVCP